MRMVDWFGSFVKTMCISFFSGTSSSCVSCFGDLDIPIDAIAASKFGAALALQCQPSIHLKLHVSFSFFAHNQGRWMGGIYGQGLAPVVWQNVLRVPVQYDHAWAKTLALQIHFYVPKTHGLDIRPMMIMAWTTYCQAWNDTWVQIEFGIGDVGWLGISGCRQITIKHDSFIFMIYDCLKASTEECFIWPRPGVAVLHCM